MSRHFVHIDGRCVHYRRAGEGPVVLAIHGSPQSSRALAALSKVLVDKGLCVIAPDTPGNGMSTPLAGQHPTSVDYAKALAKFADALRLGRVSLMGYHTGAATICTFGALYPDRVSSLVFNGLSCWTEAERASLLATYLPRFVPLWDGSHMSWLWARLEEQMVFFPWNEPTPETRMLSYDFSSLGGMQCNALDFLEAGDGYRAPYAAAFGFKTEEWLARIKAPYLLAANQADPLRGHLERQPLCDAPFKIYEDSAALFAAAAAHLKAHPGDVAPLSPPSGTDDSGLERGMVQGIFWRGRLEGTGRPLVLLHQAGGSSRIFEPVLAEIAQARPVVALDLPGHGAAADGWDTALGSVESVARSVADAFTVLGFAQPALAGQQFGGLVGAALVSAGLGSAAAQFGKPVDASEPVDLAAPSLAPQWDGAHLLRAFRIARFERLFEPWYCRDGAHAVIQGNLAAIDVHARAVDLIHAGEHWTEAVAAQTRYRPAAGMTQLAQPEFHHWAAVRALASFGA